MKIRELLAEWQDKASARQTTDEYAIRLSLHDAARVRALAAMYPGRTETQIISELLTAALDELEASFPYVQGSRVVAEDEQNDPIYEDIGPTPRFHQLTRRFSGELAEELDAPSERTSAG